MNTNTNTNNISKIKACMVGGGIGSMIGNSHRHGLKSSNYFELVAGCFSQTIDKTIKLAKEIAVDEENCYDDYKKMIDTEITKKDGARVIVIATPDRSHFEQAKYALEKGMHVICDKPVTIHTEEARTLWELSKKNNLLFGVTFTWNGSDYIEDAKNIVASGEIGEVRSILYKTVYDLGFKLLENDPTHPAHKFSWRFKKEYGVAGNISDVGAHAFQYSSYIMGKPPKRIFANLVKTVKGRECDDTDAIIMDYGNNVVGSMFLTVSALACDENKLIEVMGSKGSLKIVTSVFGKTDLHLKLDEENLKTKSYNTPNCDNYFTRLYQGYGKAIQNKTCTDYDSYISIKHGYTTMTIINSALTSHQNETWATIDYDML